MTAETTRDDPRWSWPSNSLSTDSLAASGRSRQIGGATSWSERCKSDRRDIVRHRPRVYVGRRGKTNRQRCAVLAEGHLEFDPFLIIKLCPGAPSRVQVDASEFADLELIRKSRGELDLPFECLTYRLLPANWLPQVHEDSPPQT